MVGNIETGYCGNWGLFFFFFFFFFCFLKVLSVMSKSGPLSHYLLVMGCHLWKFPLLFCTFSLVSPWNLGEENFIFIIQGWVFHIKCSTEFFFLQFWGHFGIRQKWRWKKFMDKFLLVKLYWKLIHEFMTSYLPQYQTDSQGQHPKLRSLSPQGWDAS